MQHFRCLLLFSGCLFAVCSGFSVADERIPGLKSNSHGRKEISDAADGHKFPFAVPPLIAEEMLRSKQNKHENDINNHIKVVGGRKVPITKHPYLAGIFSYLYFSGSGSILNKKWILTSGDLTSYEIPSNILVRAGSSWSITGGQLTEVEKVFTHPNISTPYSYNIGLIKVKKPFKFGKSVKPIKISTETISINATTQFAGFGYTEDSNYNFVLDGKLREIKSTALSYNDCKDFYYGMSPLNFCTYPDENASPCLRDYGSPFVYKKKVAGVFLTTYSCNGYSLYPPVFIDVSQLKGWIDDTIRDNTSQEELDELIDLEYFE